MYARKFCFSAILTLGAKPCENNVILTTFFKKRQFTTVPFQKFFIIQGLNKTKN